VSRRRVFQHHGGRLEWLRVYATPLTILLLGIGATLFIGEDFVELAVKMHAGSPAVLQIDQRTFDFTSTLRSHTATLFFTAFTMVGSPVGLGVTALGAALWLRRHHRYRALYVVSTSIVGGLLNVALKMMFARARPNLEAALRSAQGYSFPSGHAMGSTIVIGALVYVVARSSVPWKLRSALVAFLGTTVFAIGMSRVYLGVHWLSDIGAGFAAGLLWLIPATVTFETIWRVRQIRQQRDR
jgi:undecaprenyl-diphosphatase